MTVRRHLLPESPGTVAGAGRLGRHVEHDPRSRAYRAVPDGAQVAIASVRHRRMIPVTNQGDVGSCTGHAMVGDVGTQPCHTALARVKPGTILDRVTAEQLYSRATVLDDIEGVEGHWPPDDTGSSGLAACKAAREAGLISGYVWAFGLAETLQALQRGPVMLGTSWYSSFDEPGPDGLITIAPGAVVRGGHEVVLDEVDAENEIVWLTNSWGPTWGVGGRACMTWATLARLLHELGDVVVPVPLDTPPPAPAPVPAPRTDWLTRLWAWLLDWLGLR